MDLGFLGLTKIIFFGNFKVNHFIGPVRLGSKRILVGGTDSAHFHFPDIAFQGRRITLESR